MDTGRECAYDLLRAVSCFFVVILHVSAIYIDASFVDITECVDYWIASFWRVVTDMGVPCFVMLSGAFLIKEKMRFFLVFIYIR